MNDRSKEGSKVLRLVPVKKSWRQLCGTWRRCRPTLGKTFNKTTELPPSVLISLPEHFFQSDKREITA